MIYFADGGELILSILALGTIFRHSQTSAARGNQAIRLDTAADCQPRP